MTSLSALGWDAGWEAEFAPFRAKGLLAGRVCLEHNHVYRVETEQGEWLAEAAGRIKYQASGRHELPAVGDWVALRPDRAGARAMIRAILARRSAFSRKAAGRGTEEQVVAANVDVVFVVFGLDHPVNARSIERYLVVASRSGARPVVVLNKADLCEETGVALAEARAAAGDTPVHAVSTRQEPGVAVLESYLAHGRTLALLGPSGAGKSSIVNALVGREALAIGEVREWDARGRHTSVHRQMVIRPEGGLIVDTPGMRELQLWDTEEPVGETFAEVQALAPGCRFRDCRHDREPGCAVKAAVEAGDLDAGRYASFLKLQGEQQAVEQRRDERAILEAKRTAKTTNKALKAMQKSRGR